MENLRYVHLSPAQVPLNLVVGPFRAVIVINDPVGIEWRKQVSEWLVRSGCLYALAWGDQCSLWDDAIDMFSLERFDYGMVPAEKQIITTWHEDETLEEVFAFASAHAHHPTVELTLTLIIHIAWHERERELLTNFRSTSHR